MSPADWKRLANIVQAAGEAEAHGPQTAWQLLAHALRKEGERVEAEPKIKAWLEMERDAKSMEGADHADAVQSVKTLREMQDRIWREMTPAQREMLKERKP